MLNQSIMAFMLNNQPTEQFRTNFLIKGEIYRSEELEVMKEVNILINTDLYLDIYSKYLKHKDILEESHFCCPVLENFLTIEKEDTFEMLGGALGGITVNGEYIFLGEHKL